GLEQARSDPACDGYIYWTIVDVGWPAAQGLLNQFWKPKRSTPDFFRQFNGPTAILGPDWPDHAVFTCGETANIDWRLSNFAAPIPNARLSWSLNQNDKPLESGVTSLGKSKIMMPNLD